MQATQTVIPYTDMRMVLIDYNRPERGLYSRIRIKVGKPGRRWRAGGREGLRGTVAVRRKEAWRWLAGPPSAVAHGRLDGNEGYPGLALCYGPYYAGDRDDSLSRAYLQHYLAEAPGV